ncbi:MAG: T9SS type A sorting domain-containing protein [Bacteroidota bacterium]
MRFFYLFLMAMLSVVSSATGQCEPDDNTAQLLPFGREGIRTPNEVTTDGDLVLEVIFVDFNDAPSSTTDTDADFDGLWNLITSNGELSRSFKRQGFEGNLIVNMEKEWKRMPRNRSHYFLGNKAWEFQDYVNDSKLLFGNEQHTSNTIAVVVVDSTVNFGGVASGAHGFNHNGIRGLITAAPTIYNDSYVTMLHEIGHMFGSPDLYPITGLTHLVGGYGMMGDTRGARDFLGWHLFRYGWLDKDRTQLINDAGTYDIDLKNIGAGSGKSLIVIPDKNQYDKLWVVEVGQDVLTQANFKAGIDDYLNREGERLIVYTVEGAAPAGLRPIRLDFRTDPPDPLAHLSTEWLDAVSYKEGQSLTNPDAPFTMDVVSKTADGFQIKIDLASDIAGGEFNSLENQTSPNGEFELHFQTDGNAVVRNTTDDSFFSGAISMGWFSGPCDGSCRFDYDNGVLSRINNVNGNVIDQHVIDDNPPANSFLSVDDEGTIVVLPCPDNSQQEVECGDWKLEGIGLVAGKSNASPSGFEGVYTYAPIISGEDSDLVTDFVWEDDTNTEERSVSFAYSIGASHPLDGQTIQISVAESAECIQTAELTLSFPSDQLGQIIESEAANDELGTSVVAVDEAASTIAYSGFDGTTIATLNEDNQWMTSTTVQGDGPASFSNDGAVFVSGSTYASKNDSGTFDLTTGIMTTASEPVTMAMIAGDGVTAFYQTFNNHGIGQFVEPGIIEPTTEINNGAEILSARLTPDGQYYCVSTNTFADGTMTSIVEAASGTTLVSFPNEATSASADLSMLVTSFFNRETGILEQQIVKWDGGTSVVSETLAASPYNDFHFDNDGSHGFFRRNADGHLDYVSISEENGSFSYEVEDTYTIGLDNYANVAVSNAGGKLIIGTGAADVEIIQLGEDFNFATREITTPINSLIAVFELDGSSPPDNSSSESDCDGDGIADVDDLDDDNDGILDAEECGGATDFSQSVFDQNTIDIKTPAGTIVTVEGGTMLFADGTDNDILPNDFSAGFGTELANNIVFNFPSPITSLIITTNDYDAGQEFMDNFSIVPTRIEGDGTLTGEAVEPTIDGATITLFWDELPVGTQAISWTSNRNSTALGVRFQIDRICLDLDGDGLPNEKDIDSDGDGCVDTKEAGHTDPDNDGLLGTSPVTVDSMGLVVDQGGYTGITTAVADADTSICAEECTACPGDNTPPEITCPADVTVTETEFENLQNQAPQKSIFGGFSSEYVQADTSLGVNALVPEGTWLVTNDASAFHPVFQDCDDVDGNPDGEILVFNGAPEVGVAVYCQDVEVLEGVTYDMQVKVASVDPFSPAMIQFAVDGEAQGEVHTASTTTCEWTTLSASWTAPTAGAVKICVLNQNNAGGGNDFALDQFEITGDDGVAITIGTVLGTATATDDCGLVTPTFVDTEVSDECQTIITRTYTAVDSCGNQSSCAQTITVIKEDAPASCSDDPGTGTGTDECDDCTDTTPPVIEGVEPFIEGECGELSIEELGVTATDNCGEVTITFEEFKFSPGCLGTIQRTYTATDKCGNRSTAIQIIDLTNENGPIFECPNDTSYQCIADVPVAVDPVVTHGCDLEIVRLDLAETMEGDSCSMVITRTWTAEDACGGVSTCVQTITVQDDEAPVVPEAPEALSVQCADDVPAPISLTATDNCSGSITSEPSDSITSGDCPNSFVVERTWIFTDECGNTSSVSQTITVEDTEVPEAPVAPAPIVVQCADDVPAAAELTATDNCSGTIVGVPTDEIIAGDCPNRFTVNRTWTFTDECGNSTTANQSIEVIDTEAPTPPEAPEAITVQCADDVPTVAELTATDNCSGTITGVPSDEITPGDCPNSFTVTRTWTFTDECGNSSNVTQTITVDDTEAPVTPEAPEAITVQCADDVPTPEALTATDNCSGSITNTPSDEITPGDCPNSFTVTRTWTFTDECGNSSSVSQTITVDDTEAPVTPEAPEAIAVQCADDVPAAVELTAVDNCSGSITGTPTDETTPGDCPNSFTVTRTWTFTDECGNTSTVTQTITVADTQAPVPPVAPAPVVVQCADDVPTAATLTAADNCDGFVVGVPSDEISAGDCPNSFVITRTWTFTDSCENSSTLSQIITVNDTEAPVVPDAPAPVTVQCADDVPEPAALSATDNCSGAVEGVPSDEITPGDCPNSFTVTRTWTFTDECGNSSSVSQAITVNDTEAPTIPDAPEPVAVQCADDVPAPAALSATDNCSGTVEGVPSDEITPGDCPNKFTVTRTWTFTDECGNSSSVSQVITVEDTEAPVFTEVPEDLTVQCREDVPELTDPTATDNCQTPTVTCTEAEDTDECGNGTITVTCTADDGCGNISTTSYIITISDTIAPELVGVPEDLVLDCGSELPEAPEVTATDNCDDDVTITFTETEVETDAVDCKLSQPAEPLCHDTENWSMVLFDLPLTQYYSNVEANFVEFADGTAHLTGTVTDNENPDGGFIIDVMFEDGMNWEEWSNQDFPTSFKDECGTGNNEDWTYYLIKSGAATITGFGHLEGSMFTLSHAPINKFFAYQVGVGASNVNNNFGNGGWFMAAGTLVVDGQAFPEIMVAGDFAFDGDCCNNFEVERTWTATDCSGNVTEATQTITFEHADTGDSLVVASPIKNLITVNPNLAQINDTGLTLSEVVPNPASGFARFSYQVSEPMQVTIDIIDASGRTIQKVFEGTVNDQLTHIEDISTNELTNGVYLIRMISKKGMTSTKFVVLR